MPQPSPNVPTSRIQLLNDKPVQQDGEYVLYWMTAFRRCEDNFALQRAVELAEQYQKPVIILEALRCGYRWASDRLHRFVLDGMADNQKSVAKYKGRGCVYYPYVEKAAGEGSGLLEALAKSAVAVIADDYPCFFLPQMIRKAARVVDVRMEAIDSNGILPMRATDREFNMAFHFRRWLQKNLRPFLQPEEFPLEHPLAELTARPVKVPAEITNRWPAADLEQMRTGPNGLADLPIDHAVTISPIAGGATAADETLRAFLSKKLPRYGTERNIPDEDAASGLSPYLHFGQISVHKIVRQAWQQERWDLSKLKSTSDGKSTGWWGASATLESFLDELITWRELGFNFCSRRRDYDRFESLPEWCQTTLYKHAKDPRPNVYTREEFERSQTHDPLWNAAQRQLVREGKIHNYLRMLWGKKVLEWSRTPQEALEVLIELNNKYALDGRDPNSYSGIFWCFGRYDRPWAPERPIFGMIRYMSSDNTAKKVKVKEYLKRYGAKDGQMGFKF